MGLKKWVKWVISVAFLLVLTFFFIDIPGEAGAYLKGREIARDHVKSSKNWSIMSDSANSVHVEAGDDLYFVNINVAVQNDLGTKRINQYQITLKYDNLNWVEVSNRFTYIDESILNN